MSSVYKLVAEPDWPFTGSFKDEEVYLLFGRAYGKYVSVFALCPVENGHPDPANFFKITKKQLVKAQLDTECSLVGVVHRHPPQFPDPSGHDIKGLPTALLGAVWCEGEVSWYTNRGPTGITYLNGTSSEPCPLSATGYDH